MLQSGEIHEGLEHSMEVKLHSLKQTSIKLFRMQLGTKTKAEGESRFTVSLTLPYFHSTDFEYNSLNSDTASRFGST